MPAPEINSFGDGDHEIGETGLVIGGGGFGAFPGTVWIYENVDRTGQSDQLTIGSWNDIQLSGVIIPGSLNNSVGTRFLFLQREDLAWSQSFSFILSVIVPSSDNISNIAQDVGDSIGFNPAFLITETEYGL